MSLVYFSDLFSVVFLELYVFNVEFRKDYSQMLGKGKNLKKNKEESSNNVAVQDPKGAAMAQLGLNLNKTTRNLRKEDIDVAFIQKMHDSEYSPELFIHPPRVPSKRAFQRNLHESYQLMMKNMNDAINLEAHKKKKLAAVNDESPDANMKKM